MLRCTSFGVRLVPSSLPSFDRQRCARSRCKSETRAERSTPDNSNRARSRKGKSVENKKRRKGRPAWTRKPDDTPFRHVISRDAVFVAVELSAHHMSLCHRDGNRDRLVGLLTER